MLITEREESAEEASVAFLIRPSGSLVFLFTDICPCHVWCLGSSRFCLSVCLHHYLFPRLFVCLSVCLHYLVAYFGIFSVVCSPIRFFVLLFLLLLLFVCFKSVRPVSICVCLRTCFLYFLLLLFICHSLIIYLFVARLFLVFVCLSTCHSRFIFLQRCLRDRPL